MTKFRRYVYIPGKGWKKLFIWGGYVLARIEIEEHVSSEFEITISHYEWNSLFSKFETSRTDAFNFFLKTNKVAKLIQIVEGDKATFLRVRNTDSDDSIKYIFQFNSATDAVMFRLKI